MEPRIFISHAWHREDLYTTLAQLLNDITHGKWVNLSIPSSEALRLKSVGEKGLLEEINLQEQVIANARQEQLELQQQIAQRENEARIKESQLDNEQDAAKAQSATEERMAENLVAEMTQIKGAERLEERIKTCAERIRELAEKAAGEKRLDAEQEYLERLKHELQSRDVEELKRRRQEVETSTSQLELRRKKTLSLIEDLYEQRATLRSGLQSGLQAIAEHIQRITNENEWRRARISWLNANPSPALYNVFQHASSLYVLKCNRELTESFPTLSLAIYERIQRADLVIAISGTFDQYRAWMEFEFAVTADMSKPLIVVIPPNHGNFDEDFPVELRYYNPKVVQWDRQQIVDIVQESIFYLGWKSQGDHLSSPPA
jgi:hypothetical protein